MITGIAHVTKNRVTWPAAALVLTLLCVSALNAAPIAPDYPDWAWTLDDGPGATTAAAEFGSVDGTIVGVVDTTTTHFTYEGNRAMDFNGTDELVALPGINISGGGNNAVTVSAWVYSRTTSNSKDRANIFGNWFYNYPNSLSTVKLYGNGDLIRTMFETPIGTQYAIGAMPKGQWVHLAAVVDGNSEGTGFAGIYVNGVLAASISNAREFRYEDTDDTVYGIAMDPGNTALTDRFFDGIVDEVAVWKGALTADNIKWLHENSITTIPEPSALVLICLGALALPSYRRLKG